MLADMVEQHFTDGHGDEAHRAEFAEETRGTLRSQFLLDAIADAEEVEVGQEGRSAPGRPAGTSLRHDARPVHPGTPCRPTRPRTLSVTSGAARR